MTTPPSATSTAVGKMSGEGRFQWCGGKLTAKQENVLVERNHAPVKVAAVCCSSSSTTASSLIECMYAAPWRRQQTTTCGGLG
jgi:hypothetical protein